MDQLRLLISAGIIGWTGLSLVAIAVVFEYVDRKNAYSHESFRERWLRMTGIDIDE